MKKPISEHFSDLGAPLRNVVNSWGAVRRADGAVILRVWSDRKRKIGDSWFRQLLHVSSDHKGGYGERAGHIDLIRKGAKGFAVIVTAKDVQAEPRSIDSYNAERLVPIGEIIEIDGEIWGECLTPVRVAEAFAPT